MVDVRKMVEEHASSEDSSGIVEKHLGESIPGVYLDARELAALGGWTNLEQVKSYKDVKHGDVLMLTDPGSKFASGTGYQVFKFDKIQGDEVWGTALHDANEEMPAGEHTMINTTDNLDKGGGEGLMLLKVLVPDYGAIKGLKDTLYL